MADWIGRLNPEARARVLELQEELEDVGLRIAEVQENLDALDLSMTYAAGVAASAACTREIEEETRRLDAYRQYQKYLDEQIELVRMMGEEEDESDLSDVERMEVDVSDESMLDDGSDRMSDSDVDHISISSSSEDSSSSSGEGLSSSSDSSDDEPF